MYVTHQLKGWFSARNEGMTPRTHSAWFPFSSFNQHPDSVIPYLSHQDKGPCCTRKVLPVPTTTLHRFRPTDLGAWLAGGHVSRHLLRGALLKDPPFWGRAGVGWLWKAKPKRTTPLPARVSMDFSPTRGPQQMARRAPFGFTLEPTKTTSPKKTNRQTHP